MRYKAGQRRKTVEYEKAIAEWWKKNKTFERSVNERPIDKSYVFYDGPPFITGNPHHGTLLSSIVKDAVPRFWTMNGYRVERRWGWDCHGLPAENFVEKQLGITDRREIGTKWSLEEYIIKARESMVANSETWRGTIDRVGRWVDFDNAYKTMNKDFMESVWWAFKSLYEAGKIYEGRKVLMYDTKFATPVSKAEVTMDNDAYQKVTDPSAYVKFRTIKKAKSYLMGVGDITERLKALNIEFTKDGNSYLIILDPNQFAAYEKLVDDALEPTHWNEYIYDNKVYFTFKDSSGNLQKFSWRPGENEDQIIKLCREYAKADFENIRKMITNNDFYREVFEDTYLLAWTTTPWTLIANRALAVSGDLEYSVYDIDGERLIVAEKLAKKLFGDKKPLKTLKGKDLAGLEYESIDGTTCKVFTADFVGEEEGTGIVHIAPAYGEDDYELYKKYSTSTGDAAGGTPAARSREASTVGEAAAAGPIENSESIGFIDVLDENGYYLPEFAEKLHQLGVRDTDENGIQIWAGNKFIAKCLEEKGIIYKIEYIKHEYPFNPRSKERIIYRAFPSWFMDIENQKPLMLSENENINWFPEYLKHGRFEKNIEAAPDWNLSRDRFWATAMPVWKGDKGSVKVIGSYKELEELSGKTLDDYHRPWVDEITFDINGEHFTRIEKVLDCWFESGSMPFAQLHYPFENKEKFEANYPADFIVEYIGQVRAWFYYVHAVNTALAEIGAFGEKARDGAKNAYKNVITTGTLAGNDGRKMSKSLGNFTDPNILMDQYSADALRFLLLSSPVLSGEDFALLDKDVSDVNRKLAMIWNVYDFFTTYAEAENIDSEELGNITIEGLAEVATEQERPSPVKTGARTATRNSNISSSPLDIWIISRIYQLRDEITEGMEEYNIPKALDGVLPFIDDMSNWFVRRSRRRFSKNDSKSDKLSAFATLRYVLIYLSKLLAPFTPFLSEELYQKMTGEENSVHLLEWPKSGNIDAEILENMSRTREIITSALALRMNKSETEDQIKIRQPLSTLVYDGEKLDSFYEQIIAEEVNVKTVENGDEMKLDKTLTLELLEEGTARELVRAIQSARKHAGLAPSDEIKLSLSIEAPKNYLDFIKSEVKTAGIELNGNFAHDEVAKINGENITISLEKI
ncbi:class I tRNA ligase family protein [Candidatus Saccharibacteria bacterium]|nr:class I tRNA ligase family protein [Candidatus Saccharibacteria bacterium]